VFAYTYPLLGIFWSMLWFFMWIVWLILLFRIFGDIFSNHEMGGFAKTLWVIFVVIVPFLGVFIYVIVHGKDMNRRSIEAAQARDKEFQSYVKNVASTGSSADELSKLADLKAKGVITDAEFAAQKAKLLA
jgi:hypothetical protein